MNLLPLSTALFLTFLVIPLVCTAREETETGYDEEFIDLVELIYGEGYLSQGGPSHTLEVMKGIDLEGKQLLELGSGLGGPAFAIAKEHHVTITGADPEPIMIAKSSEALRRKQDELKGKVAFVQMESPLNLRQFPDNHFDVVYSIESLLHVPTEHKQAYFDEIYRVLKPGGILSVLDWIEGDVPTSRDTQRMMEMDGVAFYMLSQTGYRDVLTRAHFTDIEYTDSTARHEQYSLANVDTVLELRDEITRRFGDECYFYSLESWAIQRKAFSNGEIRTGLLRARKA